MGNAASNANNRPPGAANRRLESPIRRSSQSPGPTTPSSNQAPHRSLRTKKKSLELPDLASLAITSSPHQNYPYSGTHRTSSPIPIPFSPHLNSSTPRRQHNFPSTHQLPDVFVEHPSTHNPISPKRRVNPFFRGAPLQYNSTRSFTSKPHQHHQAPTRMQEPTTTPPPVFVPETVHSTIPIALEKAESASSQGLTPKRQHASDDSQDPVSVKITWHGGGKSVILARAGDDDWKGRTVMEREYVSSLLLLICLLSQPQNSHIGSNLVYLGRACPGNPSSSIPSRRPVARS